MKYSYRPPDGSIFELVEFAVMLDKRSNTRVHLDKNEENAPIRLLDSCNDPFYYECHDWDDD